MFCLVFGPARLPSCKGIFLDREVRVMARVVERRAELEEVLCERDEEGGAFGEEREEEGEGREHESGMAGEGSEGSKGNGGAAVVTLR